MWPQLMLWDALTDWSESSPLSDSRVYALCFQHTDSIAFLCIVNVHIWANQVSTDLESGCGLWGRRSMWSLYINACFQWPPSVLQIPDDQIHLQNWIQWFMDSWIWLRIIDSVFVRRTQGHFSFQYSMPFCSTNTVNSVFTMKIVRFCISSIQMIDIFNRKQSVGHCTIHAYNRVIFKKSHTRR